MMELETNTMDREERTIPDWGCKGLAEVIMLVGVVPDVLSGRQSTAPT